jgi:hypothetical protein
MLTALSLACDENGHLAETQDGAAEKSSREKSLR